MPGAYLLRCVDHRRVTRARWPRRRPHRALRRRFAVSGTGVSVGVGVGGVGGICGVVCCGGGGDPRAASRWPTSQRRGRRAASGALLPARRRGGRGWLGGDRGARRRTRGSARRRTRRRTRCRLGLALPLWLRWRLCHRALRHLHGQAMGTQRSVAAPRRGSRAALRGHAAVVLCSPEGHRARESGGASSPSVPSSTAARTATSTTLRHHAVRVHPGRHLVLPRREHLARRRRGLSDGLGLRRESV